MIRTKFAPPAAGEYAEYFERYINKFTPEDFLVAFERQIDLVRQLFGSISEEQASELHEPYTWNLKQVMGHLIDCERIFGTRLLRVAVGDETPIPGMDQNVYVDGLDYDAVTMASLLDEFENLRRANVLLADRIPAESLERMGTASDSPISAKANLFILGGHVDYHLEIVTRRLGKDT